MSKGHIITHSQTSSAIFEDRNKLTDLDETSSYQVIMALSYVNNEIGVAIYEEISNTIYAEMLKTTMEDLEFNISNLKITFEPTLLLLHPAILSNSSLLELILIGVDGTSNAFQFKTLRSTSWNEKITTPNIYSSILFLQDKWGQRESNFASNQSRNISRNRINIPEIEHTNLDTYRKLEIAVEIEQPRLRQSLGALICYLQGGIFNLDQGKVTIAAIRQIRFTSFMKLDDNTLKALSIFSEEDHPNLISESGKDKEGFSLYGLFDRTRSILGRKKLRDWMRKPMCDLANIQERQKSIGVILLETNRDLISQISKILRHVADIPRHMIRIKKVQGNFLDWTRLFSSLVAGNSILDKIEDHLESEDATIGQATKEFIFNLFKNVNSEAMQNAVTILNTVIDFPETESNRELIVREGYDEMLDKQRELYDGLENFLYQAAQELLELYPMLEVSYLSFPFPHSIILYLSNRNWPWSIFPS
jgi:hypothetical protein